MYQKQSRLISKKDGRTDELEAGQGQTREEQDSSKSGPSEEAARADESRDGSEIELTEQSIL